MRIHRPRRRISAWIAGIVVALTLVLSSSGYVSGGNSHAASSAVGATPSPSAEPNLAWSAVAWPAGASAKSAGIAVSAQGAGQWACAPSAAGQVSIWTAPSPASTSSSAPDQWQPAGTLSLATPEPVSSCRPLLDQNDLHAIAVVLQWGSGEAGTLRSLSYFSADGVTWQQLTGDLSVGELASAGGERYALLLNSAAPSTSQQAELVVSSDDLQTWRVLRPKGLAASDSFFAFWLNPAGTELLAASYNDTLWTTRDAGANWTRLTTPAIQTSLAAWLPATNQWELCGRTGMQAQQTYCSADLGTTWQAQPTITTAASCHACATSGAPVHSSDTCLPNAILPDGSLVAVCTANGTSDQPSQGPQAVYHLAPGSATWTALGNAPGGFFALTHAGQLWCMDTAGQLAQTQLPS